MIINYERITKNLTQFILDTIKSNMDIIKNLINNIQQEVRKETFESISKNLKSYDFKILFDENTHDVTSINYLIDDTILFTKLFERDNNNIIKIILEDVLKNIKYIKNINYDNNQIRVSYDYQEV